SHLASSLAREGDSEDGTGFDAMVQDEVRDAADQNAGFAAAGTRLNEYGTVNSQNGFLLTVVQTGQDIRTRKGRGRFGAPSADRRLAQGSASSFFKPLLVSGAETVAGVGAPVPTLTGLTGLLCALGPFPVGADGSLGERHDDLGRLACRPVHAEPRTVLAFTGGERHEDL